MPEIIAVGCRHAAFALIDVTFALRDGLSTRVRVQCKNNGGDSELGGATVADTDAIVKSLFLQN